MILIRPVTQEDTDALEQFAVEAGTGMTSLPRDRALLTQKIQRSVDSFRVQVDGPGEELYWFAMEDSRSGRVVGSCAIYAGVGKSQPFYSFKVIYLTHTSQQLDAYEPVRALQMVDEYRGSTEIGTLYLTPEYRKDRNGRFLSLSRFLFIAEFPQRIAERVIAEMRGVQDENGHSVFWDSLGRHFIKMSFSKADYLSSLGKTQFIADLMPKHPVYVRLLPEAAQSVIGAVHESTRPAHKLLRREGFRFEGCVDVFDAGPTLVCPRTDIRTVRESRTAQIGELTEDPGAGPVFMVSNCRLSDYRCVTATLSERVNGTVSLDTAAADSLGVLPGDRVRYAGL